MKTEKGTQQTHTKDEMMPEWMWFLKRLPAVMELPDRGRIHWTHLTPALLRSSIEVTKSERGTTKSEGLLEQKRELLRLFESQGIAENETWNQYQQRLRLQRAGRAASLSPAGGRQ